VANLTIVVDDGTLKKARIRALEEDPSVNRGPEHHAEQDDQAPVMLDQEIDSFHGR
jgi:hypothetical protein